MSNMVSHTIVFENFNFINVTNKKELFYNDFSYQMIIFRNCNFTDIVSKESSYLFMIYNSELFFEKSQISNFYPSFFYGFFSNFTIFNNIFDNNIKNEIGLFYIYSIYLEYCIQINIIQNFFSNLESFLNSPVFFLKKK